jgi:prepilin-type N-terminal cleavage/methylation domain-containing protein
MKKGFTLVELLIVIGILAIIATVTVVVLNPAEILRQTRDSTRISDLDGLRSALAVYVATVANPNMSTSSSGSGACAATVCFTHAAWGATATPCGFMVGQTTHIYGGSYASTAIQAVDGIGWIPVNFGAIPGGSPLSKLPIDPINNESYTYGYACDDTNETFELDGYMESSRYGYGGADDKTSTDGGDNKQVYEVGTEPGLDL